MNRLWHFAMVLLASFACCAPALAQLALVEAGRMAGRRRNRHRPRYPVSSGAPVDRGHALRVVGKQDRAGWWGRRTDEQGGDGRSAGSPNRPEQVGDALATGKEVRIAGCGTFGTRSRPARTGRNPRTGEAVSISASTSPTLKAGKTLKDALEMRRAVIGPLGARGATTGALGRHAAVGAQSSDLPSGVSPPGLGVLALRRSQGVADGGAGARGPGRT